MYTSRRIAGQVGYGLASLAAVVTLVASGYLHNVTGLVAATEKGIAINGSPTAATSAMNILVMGLESRTNYEGQPLSVEQLVETHSGNEQSVASGEVGAQDTDTLILVHIFAGGQKAVGFSIPRDDLVTYPSPTYLGITEGKIDQAYDFAYNQSLGQTYGSSMTSDERYLKANQAGQAFEIATVEAVTGVHIDHFVEANLIGFYNLAQAFGGGAGTTARTCAISTPGGMRSTTATTSARAVRSTCTSRHPRRWRSSGPGTRSPGPTWAARNGSRRLSITSCGRSSTKARSAISACLTACSTPRAST